MRTIRNITFAFAGLSVLALSGCGEGWEAAPVRGKVPYMEERTAGPGIEYVRAMLLPEKGPVLELESPEIRESIIPEEEPIKDAAPLFEKEQVKGQK